MYYSYTISVLLLALYTKLYFIPPLRRMSVRQSDFKISNPR